MTKQELAAENARLREENEGLRDLLAAVSLVAGTVPTADGAEPEWKELRRAAHVLSGIKVAADPGGSWAWGHATGEAAKFLRERAAEPVGYEVYVPAAQDEMPPEVAAKYSVLPAEHRDTDGETWTTAGLTVAAKAAS